MFALFLEFQKRRNNKSKKSFKKHQKASSDSESNSDSDCVLAIQVGINSVKNKILLPDYLNEFSYTILAKFQMKNELVSEIILMLIPPGDRRTKNKKSKKLKKLNFIDVYWTQAVLEMY